MDIDHVVKVYLAGKIKKNCWRHDIFNGLREIPDENITVKQNFNMNKAVKETIKEYNDYSFYNKIEIKNIKNIKIKYQGPYFIGCDHGCFHGPQTHGCGVSNITIHENKYVNIGCNGELNKKQIPDVCNSVISSCLESIKKSNFIFCWINEKDIYGTLVELGYAKALNKNIFITIDKSLKDSLFDKEIWFAKKLGFTFEYCSNHIKAWKKFENYILEFYK